MIHQITHPSPLVKKKVNYFADYFDFVATYIGVDDTLEVENPLSLVEKIIFQINHNPAHCHKYLDSYLSHPLLANPREELRMDKTFLALDRLIKIYKAQGRPSVKLRWLAGNSSFMNQLLRFKRSYQRKMFKNALKSIVSYLNCVHDLPKHQADLNELTRIMVSEFVLNDRSKKDLKKTFQKILSKEIWEFPFPAKMSSEPSEVKENYITNRTFQQQFDGIYNLLRSPLNKSFLIFRVYGVILPDNFSFKYNKVIFYGKANPKIDSLIENCGDNPFLKRFLEDGEDLIFAIIRAEYYSIDVAVNEAVAALKTEVAFLNQLFKISCSIDPYSYLATADFKSFGWHSDARSRTHKIEETDRLKLKDNPFASLKGYPLSAKSVLLRNESVFLEALATRNVALYWQYLEAIVPIKENNDRQVIDIVSSLLLLNCEKDFKKNLEVTIINSILPFSTSHENLKISKDRQQFYFEQIFNNRKIDFNKLQREIDHPFLNNLLKDYLRPFRKQDYVTRKQFYQMILWETQGQRNSIVHNGVANDKALISLDGTLTRLVRRFRIVLFGGVRKRLSSNYIEIVNRLKINADALLE